MATFFAEAFWRLTDVFFAVAFLGAALATFAVLAAVFTVAAFEAAA